tara:strand:+ start:212 stop:595 length:384 start_codon:yes stop_codon:yes gene_type:complete
MESYGSRTLNEYDTFNPVRNLWRNVLIVAISDAIKIKANIVKFKEFYEKRRFHELDYVTLPNSDFAKICEYSELDHNLVRKKIIITLNNMEKNYDKDNMPSMPWKRLYQSKGINREASGNHTAVSEL